MQAVSEEIQKLEKEIRAHNAMEELKNFGLQLEKIPLDDDGLKVFFASMGAFFWDIPTGILSLALRVCDDWAKRERYDATSKGAYILFADVDEYGLHEQHKGMLPTHHQLFRDLTSYIGVNKDDLMNSDNIVPEGTALGRQTTEYYRNKPIGQGLGFHLASETTSNREFNYFLKGFKKHAAHYGIKQEDDPVLEFFKVHTIVEPMHKSKAKEIIEIYAEQEPGILDDVRTGAIAFMDGFEKLFYALNQRIFAQQLQAQAV